MDRGEIIIYQTPDGTTNLDVRLENETIWLTQAQIAELFGTKRPAITKHLINIFYTGELYENSVCSILEHMGKCIKQNTIPLIKWYMQILHIPLHQTKVVVNLINQNN